MSQTANNDSHDVASEKIIVGIDGSEDARVALHWALAHAKATDRIEVIHTWTQPLMAAEAGYSLDPQLFADSANAVLDAEMELVKSTDAGGPEIEARCVEGHAGTALLRASDDADLIVIGTRGRNGFVGALLGSTSTYLAHHAKCPVVIVPSKK